MAEGGGESSKKSRGTHQSPPHEIPLEIHFILIIRRLHIHLMQIRLHRVVVRQFVEQHLVGFDLFLPLWGCVVRDGEADEVVGEFEAGVGVGVHCVFRALFVCLFMYLWQLKLERDKGRWGEVGYIW